LYKKKLANKSKPDVQVSGVGQLVHVSCACVSRVSASYRHALITAMHC